MTGETVLPAIDDKVIVETPPKGENVSRESETITNLKAALHEERQSRKELKKQLEDTASAALAEQSKFKELYEEIKPKYDDALKVVDEFNSHFETSLTEMKLGAPKEVVALLPAGLNTKDQVSWLTRAVDTFAGETPTRKPDLTGIRKPGEATNAPITPEEYMKLPPNERQNRLDDMLKARQDKLE